jgi:multidrug resistance protein, MATE family
MSQPPAGPERDVPRADPAPRGTGRRELSRLLTLAGPVVVAELGWMAMGLVDTIMVGRLGPEAIGATGLGSSLFMAVAIFGMGLLLGLDTLVSQAFGARRLADCHRWLVHGLVLGLVVALPMTLAMLAGARWLPAAGLHPDVERLTIPYVGAVTWSLVPLLCYAAFRRYLQGMAVVRPISVALVTANLVNVAANWVLIYGNLGVPALGVRGAAWATVISRVYMAAVLLAAIVLRNRQLSPSVWTVSWHVERARLRQLVGLGFPAAAQVTLEVGAFAAATALAGRLNPVALASHQIALNIAAFTFMVPLGFASAGAVLVGHAVGRRDGRGAARAGWTALLVIAGFMCLVAVTFIVAPRLLIGIFTTDGAVLRLGTTLLLVAAVFQLFDGLQAVATGVLRGLGDTRTAMVWNVVGHWLLGLPVGYTLCFAWGWGVTGLWVGLSVGLIVVGVVLVATWARRVRHFGSGPGPVPAFAALAD